MTGDQDDFAARLRAVLPDGWFPDETPILDGVLAGLGSAWAAVYQQLLYCVAQTRIATATGVWLDVAALDFFGTGFTRRVNEKDPAFSARIRAEMFRERGTRAAIIATLTDLTGRAPIVFEPALASDTGGYGVAMGYGVAGRYGSLSLPYQFFVQAFRPHGGGIANVAGYGTGGVPAYGSASLVQGQITDADIYAATAAVLPECAVAWTRITP